MDVGGRRKSSLLIVTGGRGAGKSTFCEQKAREAIQKGRKVAGLLSIAKFIQEEKVGIEIEDLSNGERQLLASIWRGTFKGPRIGPWFFNAQTIQWGNKVLQQSLPGELLVVDELGVLEFEREQGFMAAFDILDQGEYQSALVVIRPEYLERALERWPWAETNWIPLLSLKDLEV